MLVLLKFFLSLVFPCTLPVYLVFNFNQIPLLSIKKKKKDFVRSFLLLILV